MTKKEVFKLQISVSKTLSMKIVKPFEQLSKKVASCFLREFTSEIYIVKELTSMSKFKYNTLRGIGNSICLNDGNSIAVLYNFKYVWMIQFNYCLSLCSEEIWILSRVLSAHNFHSILCASFFMLCNSDLTWCSFPQVLKEIIFSYFR